MYVISWHPVCTPASMPLVITSWFDQTSTKKFSLVETNHNRSICQTCICFVFGMVNGQVGFASERLCQWFSNSYWVFLASRCEGEIHLLVQNNKNLVTASLRTWQWISSNKWCITPCFSPGASLTELSLFRPSFPETLISSIKQTFEWGFWAEKAFKQQT